MTANQRIMIVDDEEVMRDFLLEVFAENKPIGADSAETALELLQQNEVDLIITDLKMPGMDGLSLLKQVKKQNSKIKVIVVTGYASLQTASDCIQAGASDFLKKPFSIAQIRNAVAEAVK